MSTTIPPTHQRPGPPHPPSPLPDSAPWPPPYGPAPAPPPGRSRRGLVALLVVLAALAIAAGALLLTGGGDGASPEETLDEYIATLRTGNCTEIVDFWTDDFLAGNGIDRAEALDLCRTDFEMEDVEVRSIEVVDQSSGWAAVRVNWVGDDSGDVTEEFGLVRQGGRWRIDSIREVS